jgi:hypothetical protein
MKNTRPDCRGAEFHSPRSNRYVNEIITLVEMMRGNFTVANYEPVLDKLNQVRELHALAGIPVSITSRDPLSEHATTGTIVERALEASCALDAYSPRRCHCCQAVKGSSGISTD